MFQPSKTRLAIAATQTLSKMQIECAQARGLLERETRAYEALSVKAKVDGGVPPEILANARKRRDEAADEVVTLDAAVEALERRLADAKAADAQAEIEERWSEAGELVGRYRAKLHAMCQFLRQADEIAHELNSIEMDIRHVSPALASLTGPFKQSDEGDMRARLKIIALLGVRAFTPGPGLQVDIGGNAEDERGKALARIETWLQSAISKPQQKARAA